MSLVNYQVGEQLRGRELFDVQQKSVQEMNFPVGPTIVAANLRVPENVGSVLRLADAVGSSNVFFIYETIEQFPCLRKIERTARSTDQHLAWQCILLEDFLKEPFMFGPLLALERTTHSQSLFKVQLPQKCSFLIGNESHGISSELLAYCAQAIHIPMLGVNGSMNVTHALAMSLFEWSRQISENT
jgi:tRNA G18 (ribose-2'-O)-methylase SpoU